MEKVIQTLQMILLSEEENTFVFFFFCYFLFMYLFTFETRSHYVALHGVELSIYSRHALHSQSALCICLHTNLMRTGFLFSL